MNIINSILTGFLTTILIHFASSIHLVAFTPNTIRIGMNETIAVVVFDNVLPVELDILIQDFPRKTSAIFSKRLILNADDPQLINFIIHPSSIPQRQLSDAHLFLYCSITAVRGEIRKKIIVIPVTKYSGYAFVQTDKPIYRPNQRVHIRVFHLNELLLPQWERFVLEIKNPFGTTVMHKKTIPQANGMIDFTFSLSQIPIFGNWSVSVKYGFQFSAKSRIHFEVKKYVLPVFSVYVETEKIIFSTQNTFRGKVIAKYSYGKRVEGFANLKILIKTNGEVEIPVGDIKNLKVSSGEVLFQVNIKDTLLKKGLPWFPEIDKSVLIMKAEVVEKASGKREAGMGNSYFSVSPYQIDLKKSLKDFKPGFPYQLQAKISFIHDEELQSGISVKMVSLEKKKKDRKLITETDVAIAMSDKNGYVFFDIDTEKDDDELNIKIQTNDKMIPLKSQVSEVMRVHRYYSPQNTFVWIQTVQAKTHLKVGNSFQANVMVYPEEKLKIFYLVLSRGRILEMNKTEATTDSFIITIQFEITYQMIPSFRLIVFIIKNGEIIADSRQYLVEKTCSYNNGYEFSITADTSTTFKPGENIKFKIRAEDDSYVGILAVDESINSLNDRDLLTKRKFFSEIESRDLGNSAGGGYDAGNVFKNGGLFVLSTARIPHRGSKDDWEFRGRLTKRNLQDKVNDYSGNSAICCRLGQLDGPPGMDCQTRSTAIHEAIGELFNCSSAFYDCCQHAIENKMTFGMKAHTLGKESNNFLDVETMLTLVESNLLKNIRRLFPETWFFDKIHIGSSQCKGSDKGICELSIASPHRITTWSVQAIGISKTTGMCIADPILVRVFKSLFVELYFPQTVIIGEELEILATVYNYLTEDLNVTVLMYRVEGICMGIESGDKTPYRYLYVKANTAESITFPIVPIEVKTFNLRVAAITWTGSDVIEKVLEVLPAGIQVKYSKSFTLDPARKRNKPSNQEIFHEVNISSKIYNLDSNKQLIKVDLEFPYNYVPGSERSFISIIGDPLGTAVNTSLWGLERFIQLPTGCAEQMISKLAALVQTMRYLKRTHQMTEFVESNGTQLLYEGFSNILRFRTMEGSYEYYKPTWVTSYITKILCQSSEFIQIPVEIICESIHWLSTKQLSNGEFEEIFASNFNKLQSLIPRSVRYLEGNIGLIQRPYSMALVAYALSLAKSLKAIQANEKLINMAFSDEDNNIRYWSEVKYNASNLNQRAIYNSISLGRAIETTSYALLTQLLNGNISYSHSIANWLVQQRGYEGSFVSTQDSAIALQSLVEYNIKAEMPVLNMNCSVISSTSELRKRNFKLNKKNSLVLLQFEIPSGDHIYITSEGTGLATLTISTIYNIEKPQDLICGVCNVFSLFILILKTFHFKSNFLYWY